MGEAIAPASIRRVGGSSVWRNLPLPSVDRASAVGPRVGSRRERRAPGWPPSRSLAGLPRSLVSHPEKTRLVDLGWGKESFEFLGCRLRKCRSVRYPGRMFLQRWPSPKSMKRIRARIRGYLDAGRSGVKDVQVLIAQLNPVLRGWGDYFRTGNATLKFTQLDHYVHHRLGLFSARRRGIRHSARHGLHPAVRLVLEARTLSFVRYRALPRARACLTPSEHR